MSGVTILDLKPWTLMFIGSFITTLISVALIWNITITKDVSNEWIVWLAVVIAFMLFLGGYLYEQRYKREHPEEFDIYENVIDDTDSA